MTDTITPASLRAHADWCDTRVDDDAYQAEGAAVILRRMAARLEAESARDEEAEKLAKRLHERLIPDERSYGGKVPDWFTPVIRDLLDFLAADGRLLPEGGTVLTAEQAAEARELLDAVDLDAEEFHHLRAAFTPPAVSVPDSGPDGTPEKPWPTWQDVPEGVEVVPTGLPERFVKIDGRTYIRLRAIDAFKRTTVKPTDFAPFVRVDGGVQ